MEPLTIGMLLTMATSALVSAYQGERQLKQQKKEFRANQAAAAEARQAANDEAIAQKQALVAEQQSMASGQQEAQKKKRKSTYQQQATAYQSYGSGWGLGTQTDGKLG